jgi:short-subunit dehydrogenase
MNILILGASSQIGHEVAVSFSCNNNLTLLGRRSDSLNKTAEECINFGAINVDVLVLDISKSTDSFIEQIKERKYDLIVNLISTTSRVKDSDILVENLDLYLLSDLVMPIRLINELIKNSNNPLKIIFISSVLEMVPSPNKILYGSLKFLQNLCLKQLEIKNDNLNLLVVRVGSVVPYEKSSYIAKNLAREIHKAHLKNLKVLNFGYLGFIYVLLFYIHPLIFYFIVNLQRMYRNFNR